MMYVYDMHVHSCRGSLCGRSSVEDMVKAFCQAGYSGFVLTEHFIHGNTAIPRDLPWEERMKRYYAIYEDAVRAAAPLDFDVLFGLEHAYAPGREVLTYGIDLAFLLSHPELEKADVYQYTQLVREAGGLCIHAHPYRFSPWMKKETGPKLDAVDGMEGYNACNQKEDNDRAQKVCAEHAGFLMTSGSDAHGVTDKIGYSGLAFSRRMRTGQDLVSAMKAGEAAVIIDEPISRYTGR